MTDSDNLLDNIEHYFNYVFPNRKMFCKAISLSILSALTRNSVRADRNTVRHTIKTNTYVLLCGASGAGKSTIREHAMDILADIGYKNMLSDDITPEAVPKFLHTSNYCTMFIQEFGSFLGVHKKKTYLSGLTGMLTKAYDGAPISQERTSRDSITASDYSLSIMAEIQPAMLSIHADGEDIQSGFLPRFMMFYEDELDSPGLQPLREYETSLKKNIIDNGKKLFNAMNKLEIECKFEYKHNREISSAIKKILKDKALELEPFFRRMEPAIYKLSMIKEIGKYMYIQGLNEQDSINIEQDAWMDQHTYGKKNYKIPISDASVEWAIDMVEEVLVPNINKVTELLYTSNADKVLLVVKNFAKANNGAAMPRSLLYRSMGRYLDTNREMDDNVELAMKMEYIEKELVQGGTRFKLFEEKKSRSNSDKGDDPWQSS